MVRDWRRERMGESEGTREKREWNGGSEREKGKRKRKRRRGREKRKKLKMKGVSGRKENSIGIEGKGWSKKRRRMKEKIEENVED